MKFIFGVILFFILYGLIGEANDAKKYPTPKKPVQSKQEPVLPPLQTLIKRYEKAYDSHSEQELASIAEELIGVHYMHYSAGEWDEAGLLESAVQKRPYIYQGDRAGKKGLSLIDIFRKDNLYIQSLKNR